MEHGGDSKYILVADKKKEGKGWAEREKPEEKVLLTTYPNLLVWEEDLLLFQGILEENTRREEEGSCVFEGNTPTVVMQQTSREQKQHFQWKAK